MNTLIKVILMSIFPFYRVDFPMAEFPKGFTYIENNHGQIEKQIVTENDSAYLALKMLMMQEKHGWSYSVASYNSERSFTSPTLTILCFDHGLVASYIDEKGQPVQISKSTKGSCPIVPLNLEKIELRPVSTLGLLSQS